MADVHVAQSPVMGAGAPLYSGHFEGETISGGAAGSLEFKGAGFAMRVTATTGASYVRLTTATSTASSAANAAYLAEGTSIDLYGTAGDVVRQDDA